LEHYIHLLFAFALFRRMGGGKDAVFTFLFVLVGGGIYDLVDWYLFFPLMYLGLLPLSPIFVHRSITHTIWFVILLTLLTWRFVNARYAKIMFTMGTLAHLVPDILTGGVKVLMPISYLNFEVPLLNFEYSTGVVGVVFIILSLILLYKDIRNLIPKLKTMP
jgi:membrane-bound metal-dependent hydrolase YbcI (DUF457 family)